GANDGHRLRRREETVLVEPFVRRQFVPLPVQALQILLSHVSVAGRDVDNEGRLAVGRCRLCSRPFAPVWRARPGGEAAHQGTVKCHHWRKSSITPSGPATRTRTSFWFKSCR